jgi:4-hydroxy-3-methylbut-2-en-1-yl diphosphate synthase IspG/GcpE
MYGPHSWYAYQVVRINHVVDHTLHVVEIPGLVHIGVTPAGPGLGGVVGYLDVILCESLSNGVGDTFVVVCKNILDGF